MSAIYILAVLFVLNPYSLFSQDKNEKNSSKTAIQYPDTEFFSKHYREHFLEKDEFYGKREMNGISFDDYLKDFDKLKLITFKYRDDSNELRLVYGNDLAIKGIRDPEHKFETGATIYKLAYPSISDPAFISSKTPGHGYIRYQAMKYNPKRYSTGWGYAIFGYDGKTFPGNPVTAMETCIACHDLVKDRNYVFSVMMENPDPRKAVPGDKEIFQKVFTLNPEENKAITTGKSVYDKNRNITFEMAPFGNIPDRVKIFVQQKTQTVNKLSGSIMAKPFVAFMPEIVPLLITRTLKSRLPSYGVINKTKTFFVFTYIGQPDESCNVEKTNIYYGVGYYRLSGASNLLLNKKCFDKSSAQEFKSN